MTGGLNPNAVVSSGANTNIGVGRPGHPSEGIAKNEHTDGM